MNRRAFLGAIAAAVAFDPDRALWTPGRKMFSFPSTIQVLPPCPLRMYPAMVSDIGQCIVLNELVRRKWQSDAAFRHYVNNHGADLRIQSQLNTGTGFFHDMDRYLVTRQ